MTSPDEYTSLPCCQVTDGEPRPDCSCEVCRTAFAEDAVITSDEIQPMFAEVDAAGRRRYHKPSRDELAERIQVTIHCLNTRVYKSDIKKMLKRRYGVDARTIERYLSRARRVMAAQNRKSKTPKQYRQEARRYWRAILGAKIGTLRDQFYAEKRLEWLDGLRPPCEGKSNGGAPGDRAVPVVEVVEVLVRSRQEAQQILALPPPQPGKNGSHRDGQG
jgi:hypothetical protein